MMRKIAVPVISGLLLAGLLAVPASAQENNYVPPDIVRPRIIERVVAPAPPAVPATVERPLAATGLDLTVGMVLSGLLILGGGGLLLVARRRRQAAPG